MLLLGFEALTGWLLSSHLLPVLILFEKFFCRVGRSGNLLLFWLSAVGGGAFLF
jgi:hypothetical protein